MGRPRAAANSYDRPVSPQGERDVGSKAIAAINGRRPKSDQELNEWLASPEGSLILPFFAFRFLAM
jgi:hypothetical protein